MMVSNIKSLNFEKIYECNNEVGKFLIKKGVPLLGRNKTKMFFARTSLLLNALQDFSIDIKKLAGEI